MKVKDFRIENTGGHIYVAWGEFEDGNYFAIGSDLLLIYDEDEYAAMEEEGYDGYEWENQHTINSYSYGYGEFMNVLKQIYDKTDMHDIDLFESIEDER